VADLAGAHAKIQRSREHLNALYRSIKRWDDAKTYAYSLEPDPEDRARWLVRLSMPDPPDVTRWALIFGDLLSCCRAALDHTVYALAVAHNRTDPPPDADRLQYPICDTKPAFWSAREQRRIAALSPAMRAEIYRSQPCVGEHGTREPALNLLRTLNNADKHKLLHIAALVPQRYEGDFDPPIRGECRGILSQGPTEDGAVVLTLEFSEPQDRVQMGLMLTLFIGLEYRRTEQRYVGLGDAAGACVIATRNTVGRLERFIR